MVESCHTNFSVKISEMLADLAQISSRARSAGVEVWTLRTQHDLSYEYDDDLQEAEGYVEYAAKHLHDVTAHLNAIAAAMNSKKTA